VDLTNELLLIALIAVFAQTVNGAMGMGYGAITSSFLLTMGIPPVTMSTTIHIAQLGTTVTSGVSHWRLGNINWPLTIVLGLAGAVGGFAGATFLASIPTQTARPLVTVILLTLGVIILLRVAGARAPVSPVRWRRTLLAPLGGIAGFFNATGGGGWGPITMGTLMSRPPEEPRKVIGSVNASEIGVSVAASIGFMLALGFAGIPWDKVAALLIGGMVAAPPAAWLARHIPAQWLGVSIGVLLLVLNTRMLTTSLGFDGSTIVISMLAVAASSVAFVAVVRGVSLPRRSPAEREEERTAA
jgi:uncharacterized protein